MRYLLLPFLLLGCATAGSPGGTDEQAELAKEIGNRLAGAPTSCVPVSSSESLVVIDSRTLVLRSGSTLWVNRLRGSCPGLRPLGTVIVEVQGNLYCRGDRIRGLEPGSTIPGPICPLSDFVPYRRPT